MGRMENFGDINPVQRQESNPIKLSAEEMAQLEKELGDFDPDVNFAAAEDIIIEMNAAYSKNERPTDQQLKRFDEIRGKMFDLQSNAKDIGIDPSNPKLVRIIAELGKVLVRKRTLN